MNVGQPVDCAPGHEHEIERRLTDRLGRVVDVAFDKASAVGEAKRNSACPQFCDACFSGDYPTTLTDYTEREAPDLLTLPVNRVA